MLSIHACSIPGFLRPVFSSILFKPALCISATFFCFLVGMPKLAHSSNRVLNSLSLTNSDDTFSTLVTALPLRPLNQTLNSFQEIIPVSDLLAVSNSSSKSKPSSLSRPRKMQTCLNSTRSICPWPSSSNLSKTFLAVISALPDPDLSTLILDFSLAGAAFLGSFCVPAFGRSSPDPPDRSGRPVLRIVAGPWLPVTFGPPSSWM
mmetsp:Transcript_2857/g.11268  ORF Transcript_2857/g.11268 Transcript_2857/m.11268 type:complete len:205 (+) Transcript_2857:1854-2468(+)